MKSRYIHGDCMAPETGLPSFPDNFFAWAVVDPPYGIGEDGRKKRVDKDGRRAVKQKNGNILYTGGDYESKGWDNEPPSIDYFKELFRVSKNQIIWGINNFINKPGLQVGPGRIFWDKVNYGSHQSDGEIAYCSAHDSTRLLSFMWNGMMQGKNLKEGRRSQGNKKLNEKRIHPTQKPTALYHWIAQKYFQPGDTILDTHVGSGSSLITYEKLGYKYIAYEIDGDYYKTSSERIKAATYKGLFQSL